MSAHGGPKNITTGLVLSLDAADLKSYPRTGNTWYDRSGNRNHKTSTTANFVNVNKGAILFNNNVNNSFSIASNNSLRITGDQTIEYFYMPIDRTVRRNVYAKAYAGEGTITHETDGTLNYYYGNIGDNTGNVTTNYQVFPTLNAPLSINNKVYHVVLVRDLVTQREGGRYLYWFINGVQNNRASALFTAATPGTLPVTIGTGYAGNAYGRLYNFKLYNKALSPQEVLQNYNATKARFQL